MSGPIVRKYGFPNFEKIFGERPLEHGAEENRPAEDRQQAPKSTASKNANPSASNPSDKKGS